MLNSTSSIDLIDKISNDDENNKEFSNLKSFVDDDNHKNAEVIIFISFFSN